MTDPPRLILVVGESLVDVVKRSDGSIEEHPGGSPANVAVALARLGATVELGTAYSGDRLGRLLDKHFELAGVGFAGDPHVLGHTSSAVATIDEAGAATYLFDIGGQLTPPLPSEEPVLVHTGSLAAVLEPGCLVVAETVARLAATATISYDVNARPAATGVTAELVRQVESLAAASDVVKASDEDLVALYPGREAASSARHLLDLGAGAVVETRGAGGAACYTPGGRIECVAEPVTVADTIGAGDSFCAAMLDGLRLRGLLGAENREALRSLPLDAWREVLARATRAAAITVSRQGANPPTRVELDGLDPKS
ncbi:PfkB family carbohydrate kinase [Nocardioides pocheonensis]|uniref:PfkB family carbohydrate kinase n=1 Tax=Nocardioides pocheonensis TaxID=661485 RepID=UPI001FE89642|nr:PfkB family carbohydrate kinase [Nocardioides pocheonensis]